MNRRVVALLVMIAVLAVPAFSQNATTTLQTTSTSTQVSQGGFDWMWLNLIGSAIALAFAAILAVGVLKQKPGTKEMEEISKHIQDGAMAYLKQQYKVVGIFFIVLFIVLGFLAWVLPALTNSKPWLSGFVPVAFITGGFFSGLSGFIGMSIATRANCRTTHAASESLNKGLRVAFNAGTVMGMTVVGLGLLDLSIWWLLLRNVFLPMGWIESMEAIPPIMITFGMGASSMALFARLGGGIYTKAADVGADLVGKVEAGIPEDDPRNPATIADNVGDNVGDVAGMGADLYESYVGSIVATMALGSVAALASKMGDMALTFIQLPAIIAILGIIGSIIATFLVRTKEDATQKNLLTALRLGVWGSTAIIAVASFAVIWFLMGSAGIGLWGALMVGLVAGAIIAFFTEYYTSDNYKPTRDLAATSQTGPATVIIGGLALGMLSTAIPVVTIVFGTLGAFYFAGGGTDIMVGLYGIGLAAVGMLSTLGITLATDAYGPVADNAGGIAEMCHMPEEVRKRTDALDSLGNTTAATGKGFAIGSAALTALALLAEYGNKIGEFLGVDPTKIASTITANLLNPNVLIGVMLGCALPFVFAAMAMGAVGRAAQAMVDEVRRQFREKPGILQGTEKPDYARCVQISTIGAQKEMVVLFLMAVAVPVLTGILFGPYTVLGLLAGATCTGFAMAIMMANAGGAWDNAKKFIEGGAYGGKKSEPHKAAVVGDTVGDPFKDTAGPCLNILIKLMSMVSIVFVGTCISLNSQIMDLFKAIFK